MAIDPKNLTTPAEARQYMENARRLNNADAYKAGFRRLCELEALTQNKADPLDALGADVWAAIAAYERLLSEKNGRRTSASRTRQKLARDGYVKTIEDLTLKAEPSPGFVILAQSALWELTFEYLVLKYPERFSGRAFDAATARLIGAGMPPTPTTTD